MDHATIELICIALIALALFVQTTILLAIFVGVGKAVKAMKDEVDEMKAIVLPIVGNTRDFITRIAPRIEATVSDAADIARSVRAQANEVETTVGEVMVGVRKQSSRVDTMISSTLDAVDKASEYVSKAVAKPVRQMSGILASVRAFVESMQSTASSPHAGYRDNGHQDDKDMFV